MRATFIQSRKHLLWIHVGNDITTVIPSKLPYSHSQGWSLSGADIITDNPPRRGPWIQSGANITT